MTMMKAGPASALTYLCQLHQLLGRRHDALRLHLIDEVVGDVGVAVVEQLADDEPVQVLSVLQCRLRTIHSGSLPQRRWLTLQRESQLLHLH